MKVKKGVWTIFREKPTKIILYIYSAGNEGIYATTIAKKIDCTYSHVVKLLKTFRKLGIIEVKKEGRIKKIELTKEGKELGKHIKAAIEIFS